MSDMHIMCCCGCRIRKPETSQYSFPKRLLVAVSVVIVIAMCLNPAEARSVEHRRRHQLTKEPIRRPNSATVERFKTATRKIKNQLRNTKRFFDQDKEILMNETRDYRDGMPEWLPTISFVNIYFHDYKSPKKLAKSMTERKFMYQMPKLFKVLKEYQVIFELLLDAQIATLDDAFKSYEVIRRKILENTLKKLNRTIGEINDNVGYVKVAPLTFDRSRMKLEDLHKTLDATRCLKYDHIAFRGYGNVLNKWYLVLRCPFNKKMNRKCAEFDAEMKRKRRGKGKRGS